MRERKTEGIERGESDRHGGKRGEEEAEEEDERAPAADDAEVLDSQFVRSMRRELEIDCVADREYFLM